MSSTPPKINYHKQEEEILKKWSEISSSYRYLHNAAYGAYKSMYTWFSLPVIILSTIAGTANFATASFPESYRQTVTLIVGGINLVSGMITTVAQFFSISENLEGHRVASVEFGKLSRNIAIELSLPVEQRSMPGTDFIKHCRTTLDSLMEKSPSIPYKIVRRFGNQFNEAEFVKPDILEILPVEIYRNTEEEFEKEKEKMEVMRKAAADEVRLQIESTAEEVAKKRHSMKKRRVSAANIADSMSRLISSMETSSSMKPPPPPLMDLEEKDDTSSDSSDLTVCTMDGDLKLDDDVVVKEVQEAPSSSPVLEVLPKRKKKR